MNDHSRQIETRTRYRLVFLACVLLLFLGLFMLLPVRHYPARAQSPTPTPTCTQPNDQDIAIAFCDAGNDALADRYQPPLRDVSTDGFIPPVILKAIGWYESQDSPIGGWAQCVGGVPYNTGGCAWGIMQISSSMNCDTPPNQFNAETQQQVKYDYRYNIAMGAHILKKWKWDPHQTAGHVIGDGDPHIVEHWYYAVWAYYNWSYSQSPNNPIWDSCAYPNSWVNCAYVDRIWWRVRNPPSRSGRTLWAPISLTRPDRALFPRYESEWSSWNWHISDPLPTHQDNPYCRACYLPLALKNHHTDTYEPNNSFGQAWPIETGAYDSYIWPATDKDYFKLTATSPRAIHVNLLNIPVGCDYDLYLYNSAHELMAQSTHGGNQNEQLEAWLYPGAYYILVKSYGGSYSQTSPYRLHLYWIGKAAAPYPPP